MRASITKPALERQAPRPSPFWHGSNVPKWKDPLRNIHAKCGTCKDSGSVYFGGTGLLPCHSCKGMRTVEAAAVSAAKSELMRCVRKGVSNVHPILTHDFCVRVYNRYQNRLPFSPGDKLDFTVNDHTLEIKKGSSEYIIDSSWLIHTPYELRDKLPFARKEPLSFTIEGGAVLIRKLVPKSVVETSDSVPVQRIS
ncbi:MAG: hypothetical protein OK422_04420 [Thaumarchaeota archaeon]|nr:hypothetical protein [Nitrososphaerota archaeon]